MGSRAQVRIQEEEKGKSVYLYTHWGAGNIVEKVREALGKRWRWNDYEYLTRIIFDVMKGKDTETEIGYGIGLSKHGDIEVLVEILPEQIVRIGRKT